MNESEEKPEKKDQIIFRSRAVYERCVEKAKLHNCTPNQLARDLVRMGLDLGLADGGQLPQEAPKLDDLRALLRKHAWCLIVALSPDLDESGADQFLRETFDV